MLGLVILAFNVYVVERGPTRFTTIPNAEQTQDHNVEKPPEADRRPVEQNPGCWIGWDPKWPRCDEGINFDR
jgi:hypothetical protein